MWLQRQRARNAFKRQVLRRLTFVPQARQLFQRRIFVVQHLDDNRRAIIPTAAINRNVTVAVNLVGQLITRHCGHKSVLHYPNIRPIMTYRAAFQETARVSCASSTKKPKKSAAICPIAALFSLAVSHKMRLKNCCLTVDDLGFEVR